MKQYIKGEMQCYETTSCSIHQFLMLVRPLLHLLKLIQLAVAHQGSCGKCGYPWRKGAVVLNSLDAVLCSDCSLCSVVKRLRGDTSRPGFLKADMKSHI